MLLTFALVRSYSLARYWYKTRNANTFIDRVWGNYYYYYPLLNVFLCSTCPIFIFDTLYCFTLAQRDGKVVMILLKACCSFLEQSVIMGQSAECRIMILEQENHISRTRPLNGSSRMIDYVMAARKEYSQTSSSQAERFSRNYHIFDFEQIRHSHCDNYQTSATTTTFFFSTIDTNSLAPTACVCGNHMNR
jgi:hypothetical protein